MSEMPDEKTVTQDENKIIDENIQTKTGNATETAENMIPKFRFDQINQQKKEAIDALKSVADLMVEDVPEAYQNLVPDLPPAQKIEWIRTAMKSGIFNPKQVNGLDTQRPQSSGKVPVDYGNMQPDDMLKAGYKS